MQNKRMVWLAYILVPVLCTGCQLMPKEEELKTAPVIHSYEVKEYPQSAVMRGDLILRRDVDCVYMAARQEELSFALGGEYIDQVYVSEGDQVHAGDLLAELQYDHLKEDILEVEHELSVLGMQKDHILEKRTLELESRENLYGEESAQQEDAGEGKNEKEEIEQIYGKQLQEIEDSLYIEQLRLDELREELKQRQIYAGIDGTVLDIDEVSEGERSVSGKSFLTVADVSTNVFIVRGEDARHFPAGMQVSIWYGKKEYTAVVTEAAALGLDERSESEGQDGISGQSAEEEQNGISAQTDGDVAYLRLDQPDPSMEDGAKGRIELTLDQRKDVLYVEKEAVRTANGEKLVYKMDENGLRVLQKVVTGFETDDYVEIVSGLEEGESVIME